MTPPNKGSVVERPAPEQGKQKGRSPARERSRASSSLSAEGAAPHAHDRLGGAQTDPAKSDHTLYGVFGEVVPLQEKLIVSPCPGRFHAGIKPGSSNGEFILEGQEIGRVLSSDREQVPVKSAFSGWIMGYLVPEGSPVRDAEPVAWLRPH